jgi:hypothetical protein
MVGVALSSVAASVRLLSAWVTGSVHVVHVYLNCRSRPLTSAPRSIVRRDFCPRRGPSPAEPCLPVNSRLELAPSSGETSVPLVLSQSALFLTSNAQAPIPWSESVIVGRGAEPAVDDMTLR